jgi:hypothetical protein
LFIEGNPLKDSKILALSPNKRPQKTQLISWVKKKLKRFFGRLEF